MAIYRKPNRVDWTTSPVSTAAKVAKKTWDDSDAKRAVGDTMGRVLGNSAEGLVNKMLPPPKAPVAQPIQQPVVAPAPKNVADTLLDQKKARRNVMRDLGVK